MKAPALVVLGCGWIARRHAAAARRLGVPLIFASRDAARAAAYARRFRALAAYGGYAEALADPRAAGAIVCTPHDRHGADVLAALAAGRHVLVEKPIAPGLEEADRMITAADQAGRVLMVAENFHYMPAFRRIRALLESGRLGQLTEIQLISRGLSPRTGWRASAAAGGGALIDGGIHYVHLLRWWGGGVRRVFALAPTRTLAMEGEDAVSLVAELAGGAVGLLSNSLAAPGVPRFQWSAVTGPRGTCFVDNRGRFVVLRGGGAPRAWLFRRDRRGHEAMLAAFVAAIGAGAPGEMDGSAGRADVAVVQAAYRSMATRAAMDVSPC
ncbi:MAG: Gfo/Idh/MocA family oxidoreductase [Candidatus Rokubacteria bacterium]|nr:Gfo/Idh/MocA family oxidoreductase [Candidatus Rokubacteria bacterium]